MRISKRLQIVFDNLIQGLDVWDMCCDHGYLAGAAYESQKFPNVFFVDQVPEIIQKTEFIFKKHVYRYQTTTQAYFIAENAENLNRKVSGNVCISGVGAIAIYKILSALAKENHLYAQKLILGPHRDAEKLIEMIANNESLAQYKLVLRDEITEKGKIHYFLIFALIS